MAFRKIQDAEGGLGNGSQSSGDKCGTVRVVGASLLSAMIRSAAFGRGRRRRNKVAKAIAIAIAPEHKIKTTKPILSPGSGESSTGVDEEESEL